uniref:L1 transposable element RRM domain-containing protein n=1 Tax=Acanthochromis polyacanthus TaxID=80966 RepID=A0A3Q1EJX9_9TELE
MTGGKKKGKKNLIDQSSLPEDTPVPNQSSQVTMATFENTSEENQSGILISMRAIIREEITAAINAHQQQITSVKAEIKQCNERLAHAEERVAELETSKLQLESENEKLKERVKKLEDTAEKLEAQSRRYNVRVFGLKHNVEKGNPTEYMAQLLKTVFKGKLPEEPVVEVAHRVGQANISGDRAMIVRLQKQLTREAILKLAKREGETVFEDMKVRIFPDLTAAVAKQRAQFKDVRKKLREQKIRNGIIHPAALIVTYNDEKKYFKDSKSAEIKRGIYVRGKKRRKEKVKKEYWM